MYKSPIEIICGDIKKQIDNDIYRVTQKYDIKVDKNELIQALQYDRNQYDKGYADGKADAMAELVRCKDCAHYFHYGDDVYGCRTFGMMKTKPEGFCSRGKRRASDENP